MSWYAPAELGKRMAVFAVISTLSGSFSGLLAFAIAKMAGIAGLNGWAWIFIIEGIVTVCFGLLCPFILADSPDLSGGWLSNREIHFLNLRQQAQFGGRDIQEKAQEFQWNILFSVLTDWMIYIMILIYWSNTAPNFAMKITMPTIMKTMGYTSAKRTVNDNPAVLRRGLRCFHCMLVCRSIQVAYAIHFGTASLYLGGLQYPLLILR